MRQSGEWRRGELKGSMSTYVVMGEAVTVRIIGLRSLARRTYWRAVCPENLRFPWECSTTRMQTEEPRNWGLLTLT